MTRTTTSLLGAAALVVGGLIALPAQAGQTPAPSTGLATVPAAVLDGVPTTWVAQGCGRGFRRGAYGRCRPAFGPGRYGQRRCFFVRTAYGPRRVCRR